MKHPDNVSVHGRPLVSVIVPVHNGERTLKRCLDSVFAQTLTPHEVFVINDGSVDSTEQAAQSYGQKITYISQPNQGAGVAPHGQHFAQAAQAGLQIALRHAP